MIINKLFLALSVAANALLLAGCNKNDENPNPGDDTELPVITQSTFTDPRDSQVYKILIIKHSAITDSLCVMAENMRYNSWDSKIDTANADTMVGRVYNFNEAQFDVCPPGWKNPSDNDWMDLEYVLGLPAADTAIGDSMFRGSIGTKLKSITSWPTPGTDTYGLNILEADYIWPNGSWDMDNSSAFFWTSTEVPTNNTRGQMRFLSETREGIGRGRADKNFMYSCRCMKD